MNEIVNEIMLMELSDGLTTLNINNETVVVTKLQSSYVIHTSDAVMII